MTSMTTSSKIGDRNLRYLPVFFLVTLLLFAGMCVNFYDQSIESVSNVLLDQAAESAMTLSGNVAREYSILSRESSFLSRNALIPVIYGDKATAQEKARAGRRFLQWFSSQTEKDFQYIAFTDEAGRVLFSNANSEEEAGELSAADKSGRAVTAAQIHDVTALEGSRERVIVQTFLDDGSIPMLRVLARVRFREYAGIALAYLPASDLFGPLSGDVQTLVLDSETGTVVYSADTTKLGRSGDAAFPELLVKLGSLVEEGVTESPRMVIVDGQRIAISAMLIEETGWIAVTSMQTEGYLGTTERTGRLTLLVCGGILLSCALAIRFLIVRVRRSAEQLREATSLIEEQNKTLSSELEKAHDMQMQLMPETTPSIPGFDVAGTCLPANHVGGDFFQYFSKPDGRVVLTLADVTGHGMEAAIPTVMFSGILNIEMESTVTPDVHFSRLNPSLYRTLNRRTFVCCTMADLDPVQRLVRIANGGCPYPYHYRASTGDVVELSVHGWPLGVRAEVEHRMIELQMEPGDVLVLCSDGIIESANEQESLFGFERTSESICKASAEGLAAADLVDRLFSEVQRFSGTSERDDDQTIIALKAIP